MENITTMPNYNFHSFANQTLFSKMEQVAETLEIQLFYYEYSSELNNLKGQWNIFLNTNQATHQILADFQTMLDKFKLIQEQK